MCVQRREVAQQFQRTYAGPGAGRLRHHPDPTGGAGAGHVVTHDPDRAGLGGEDAGAAPDHGRLPGAVGAEQGGHPVLLGAQREVVDDGAPAEAYDQVVDLEGGGGVGHPTSLGRAKLRNG
ncbi:hypothetical protein SDC9_195811 [bioreactor metagenome]|uniref:Uncharacterized protein n=1 Tax=bioreactor metagenome TaxID=1076179 RepID=A0A645IBA1_9ZZZZ